MGKDRRTSASGKMGCRRISVILKYMPSVGIAAGISLAVAFLFYNSPWGMLGIILILPAVLYRQQKKEEKDRQRRLHLEFKDYLYALTGALTAGYSIERAFLEALEEVKGIYGEASLLAEELADLDQRLGVQEPLEHILRDFADKSKNEDIENFTEVFCYAKRGGGDFLHMIQTAVGRICDKIEVSEEICTVMAEKAMEQKVMCVVPFGVLLFFRISSPEFIGRLYGNLFGTAVMTLALFAYAAAFFLAEKIVEIEV